MKERTYDWLFSGRRSCGRRGREEGGLCVPITAAGLSTRKERRWFVSAARLCGWQEVVRAPLGGEVRRSGAQSQQTWRGRGIAEEDPVGAFLRGNDLGKGRLRNRSIGFGAVYILAAIWKRYEAFLECLSHVRNAYLLRVGCCKQWMHSTPKALPVSN